MIQFDLSSLFFCYNNNNNNNNNIYNSAWFLNETGHSNPYNFHLDPQTMREVAEAAETMGGGAERDGGMWGLARMIGNTVKNGKENGNILRLEAGEYQSEELNLEGTLRRRRQGGGGGGGGRNRSRIR